jgi:hypothetical protein
MGFQVCPICMGTGLSVIDMPCDVCKGKKIIDSSTGSPPKDEGCGPSYCENCGCGKKEKALANKLPDVAGLRKAQEHFKKAYGKEPSQALVDIIASLGNPNLVADGRGGVVYGGGGASPSSQVALYKGPLFKEGTEIRFTAQNAEIGEIAEAKAVLTVGNTYFVKKCHPNGWFNDVELVGFDFLMFNSAMFEEVPK